MPWKECSVMDERMQFVARRLAGEPLAELCREFGISRKTGYKIFDRYQECGVEGLTDRSRRPYRYANKLPFQVENFILNVKREHCQLGRSENPREPDPQVLRHPDSCQEHHPCGAGSPRSGRAPRSLASSCSGNCAFVGPAAQRALVHRLQGRVPAGQSAILLPADRHRSRQPFSAHL